MKIKNLNLNLTVNGAELGALGKNLNQFLTNLDSKKVETVETETVDEIDAQIKSLEAQLERLRKRKFDLVKTLALPQDDTTENLNQELERVFQDEETNQLIHNIAEEMVENSVALSPMELLKVKNDFGNVVSGWL